MKVERKKSGILIFGIVLAFASYTNAAVVKFSFDGETAAPDAHNVAPGEVFIMYAISLSPGEGYGRAIFGSTSIIGDVWAYPEAGDLAEIWRSASAVSLVAADSQENILAGRHFGFDIAIPSDSEYGEFLYLSLESTRDFDSIEFHVVPEPGTVALLSLGGLLAFRRRRSR